MPHPRRICYVQRGDYVEALTALHSGGVETYQGQFDTIRAFESLVGGDPSLIVSIGSKNETLDWPTGRAVTFTRGGPRWLPGKLLSGKWKERHLARKMLREIERFAPTRLVLRLTGEVGVAILEWAIARKLPSAVIIASTLDPKKDLDRRFCALANDPSVAFVGNHLRVATKSLVACGLNEAKALEYDFPGRASPENAPVRSLLNEPIVLFVGTTSVDKGAGDLLDALALLRERGQGVRCVICGDGELAERCRAAQAGGLVEYLGRVPRERVTQLMGEASVVVVPSRPSFAEGLPLALLEALAHRVPVVASAHPVFLGYFQDGEGVRFFEPGNAEALAAAMVEVLSSAGLYARLSETTPDAWRRAQSPRLFGDLFTMLKERWT